MWKFISITAKEIQRGSVSNEDEEGSYGVGNPSGMFRYGLYALILLLVLLPVPVYTVSQRCWLKQLSFCHLCRRTVSLSLQVSSHLWSGSTLRWWEHLRNEPEYKWECPLSLLPSLSPASSPSLWLCSFPCCFLSLILLVLLWYCGLSHSLQHWHPI